jgi:beta-glucosidase
MPWLELVPAVVQAWYPGQRGGEAIAAILSGDAAPGGRLPISFPASEAQLARPVLDGLALTEAELAKDKKANYGLSDLPPFNVDYSIDGANVGYKWFAVKGEKPLFPFGYGLTYTSFRYDGLTASGGRTVKASVRVTNIGPRGRGGAAILCDPAGARAAGAAADRLGAGHAGARRNPYRQRHRGSAPARQLRQFRAWLEDRQGRCEGECRRPCGR